jgi:hypothetical protein
VVWVKLNNTYLTIKKGNEQDGLFVFYFKRWREGPLHYIHFSQAA